jgi:hypothetical protein
LDFIQVSNQIDVIWLTIFSICKQLIKIKIKHSIYVFKPSCLTGFAGFGNPLFIDNFFVFEKNGHKINNGRNYDNILQKDSSTTKWFPWLLNPIHVISWIHLTICKEYKRKKKISPEASKIYLINKFQVGGTNLNALKKGNEIERKTVVPLDLVNQLWAEETERKNSIYKFDFFLFCGE